MSGSLTIKWHQLVFQAGNPEAEKPCATPTQTLRHPQTEPTNPFMLEHFLNHICMAWFLNASHQVLCYGTCVGPEVQQSIQCQNGTWKSRDIPLKYPKCRVLASRCRTHFRRFRGLLGYCLIIELWPPWHRARVSKHTL